MPASPTLAQSEASRANGALSAGPITEEGKARSALNGTRHNLHGAFRLLDGEDEAEFEVLREDLRRIHAPAGGAEEHWVGEIARAYWRQKRLFALEDVALAAPLAEVLEGTDRLPSLATLARYRSRVERDLRLAQHQLETLQASRPEAPAAANAAQLRWLLARAEEQAAAGPRAPAPTLGTPEPEPAPAPAPVRNPNRHERRRLAALRRQGKLPAAAAR